jgi:hypothetical protein
LMSFLNPVALSFVAGGLATLHYATGLARWPCREVALPSSLP